VGEALALRGLTKRFGDVVAVDGIDLTVPEGAIYGFLGPNGAGKTTTLRILTGLARPSAGQARVFGHEPGSRAALSLTGFLPDVPGFYGWMRAEEYLTFVGGLFALDSATIRERVALLLDLAGLSGVDAKIGGYSRGMKQRLGIAQALMNAPRLLMLDEPTSALDPLGRKDVLDMIASLAGRTTVFFSTHILADVERVCERVAILDRGHVVAESGIAELKARYAAHRLDIRVAGDAQRVADTLRLADWATTVGVAEDGSVEVNVSDIETARREAPRLIVELGYGLESFESGEVSLEDVFVELVGAAR
jgi:ABC-2 type transport system ATP-binding protein